MSGVLVDTSVWINHFREGNPELIKLMERDEVLIHPMIIAEIGCGTPPSRKTTLADLGTLRQVEQPSILEVMNFVDREKLYGQGCGIVDMILLASTLITPGSTLWTLDNKLLSIAKKFGVMFKTKLH